MSTQLKDRLNSNDINEAHKFVQNVVENIKMSHQNYE